jgi:hypothetical protein
MEMTEILLWIAFAALALAVVAVLGLRWIIVREQRRAFEAWDRAHGEGKGVGNG